MTTPSSGPPRGLRFALLASPVVQAVRFGTKAGLTWFLVPEVYGPAALAGLVAYLLSHVALLGLNEAWVQARDPGRTVWRVARRLHHRAGLLVSAVMAAGGLVFAVLAPGDERATFLWALAPMVWLANLATLPTAHLVRHQRYAALFKVDVLSALALSVTTLGMAAAGLGAWSVLGGLYANALVASLVSLREARPLLPVDDGADGADGGDEVADVRAKGRQFCQAELLGVTGEQSDGLAVGFLLGDLAMGLYSQALTVGQMLMNYTTSLAERSLFPFLADRSRRDALGPAYAEALRVSLLFVLPAHVLMAVAAGPLVAVVFGPEWGGVAPLLMLLSLACGARCLDIVATTALKADGEAARVRSLGLARLGLLLPALAVALPFGVEAVCGAVLAARVVAAALSLRAAAPLLGSPRGDLAAGCRALVAWGLVFPAAGVGLLRFATVPTEVVLLALGVASLVLWAATRGVLDRSGLRRDWQALTARWAARGS